MTTKHVSHPLGPNASVKFIIQDYDPYVKVFCNDANKKIHAFLEDSKEGYKRGVQTEMGKTLFFHTVYKKAAVWVRAERPSFNDDFTIDFFASKKPIGTYSSKVPAIVRAKDANYYDGCKHYALDCPNQPVNYTDEYLNNSILLRERLINIWRSYDKRGWQGTLGDPEKIYPEENYITTP